MYTQYFQLKQSPFSIAPDPRYLFMSERHREALAHLLYGIGSGGGFVLLTGEIGEFGGFPTDFPAALGHQREHLHDTVVDLASEALALGQ